MIYTQAEAMALERIVPDNGNTHRNLKRLRLALSALMRVADYARFLTRHHVEYPGHPSLADREAREWKQLHTRATERAEQQHREHQLALDRHGSERFKAGASRGHEAALVEIREVLENGQPEGLDISDVLVLMLERGPADGD